MRSSTGCSGLSCRSRSISPGALACGARRQPLSSSFSSPGPAKQGANADVELTLDQVHQAVELARIEPELLGKTFAGMLEEGFPRLADPTGDRRLVRLVCRADLSQGQALDEVKPQHVPLFAREEGQALSKRLGEVLPVSRFQIVELQVPGILRKIEERLIGNRNVLSALAAA